MERLKEEALRTLLAELEKGENSAKNAESLSLDQAMEILISEKDGNDQTAEMTREEAAGLLMAELEKGRRSGREQGYIDFDDVMKTLCVSIKDDPDEHNNHTTKSTICQ